MKVLVALVLAVCWCGYADAKSRSDSSSRPRIGHHSGMNGPSTKGWGGGGGYHH